MAAYAAITLLKPGTLLDRLWAMNPRAHAELTVYGRIAGIPFVIVSGTLAFVSVGWFRRRYWGWLLGVSMIAINVLGDAINFAIGERWRGAIGVTIAMALLAYMTSREVRSYFG